MPLFRTTPELADYLRVSLMPAEGMTADSLLDEWVGTVLDSRRGKLILLVNTTTRLAIAVQNAHAMMMVRELRDTLIQLLRRLKVPEVAIRRDADIFASSRFSTLADPKHVAILSAAASRFEIYNLQNQFPAELLGFAERMGQSMYDGFGRPEFQAQRLLTKEPYPQSKTHKPKAVKPPLLSMEELRPRILELQLIPVTEIGYWAPESRRVFELDTIQPGAEADDLRVLEMHAYHGELLERRNLAAARVHYNIGQWIGFRALMHLVPWSQIMVPWQLRPNRGFLRCLYGSAECAARLHEPAEAAELYGELMELDPSDPLAVGGRHEAAKEAADRKYL